MLSEYGSRNGCKREGTENCKGGTRGEDGKEGKGYIDVCVCVCSTGDTVKGERKWRVRGGVKRRDG